MTQAEAEERAITLWGDATKLTIGRLRQNPAPHDTEWIIGAVRYGVLEHHGLDSAGRVTCCHEACIERSHLQDTP